MAKIYSIIYSYHSRYPTKVKSDYKKMFSDIVRKLEIEISSNDILLSDYLVPVSLDLPARIKSADESDDYLKNYNDYIATSLRDKLFKNKIISCVDENDISSNSYKFSDSNSHIFIYFQSNISVFPKQLEVFYKFISSILENSNNKILKRIIIVLPTSLPSITEFSYSENIQKYCDTNSVILFDKEGNTLNKESKNTSNYKIEAIEIFNKYKSQLKTSPIELFEAKLIGRIGHFKRIYKNGDDVNKYCHLFYYDGSNCVEQIEDIYRPYILDNCNNEFNVIFMHGPESMWFSESIKSIINKINNENDNEALTIIDLSINENLIHYKDLIISLKSQESLLLIDLIHSGKTIEERISKLKNINSNINLKIISAINTHENISDEHNKIVKLDNSIEFNYILPKRQVRISSGICKMCLDFGIPESDPKYQDGNLQIESYYFWKLADIYGYNFKNEENTPGYRQPMEIHPKFKEIIKVNGAYIANKIIHYFHKVDHLNEANQYTFICPHEESAEELGKSLEYLGDVAVILIPKEILEKIDNNTFDKNRTAIENKDDEWYRALSHMEVKSDNKEVVLFDEFSATGNKLNNMAKLAKEFNLNVACYFPFVHFNKDFKPDIEAKVHSLYAFNLYLSKPKKKTN